MVRKVGGFLALTDKMMKAPGVGVAAVVFPRSAARGIDLSKVLLIKRAKEPGKGTWCFPGGRLELGETMPECAARETVEECGLRITVPSRPLAALAAHDVLDRCPSTGQLRFQYSVVHVLGFADEDGGGAEPTPGDDAAEATWVSLPADESGGQREGAGKGTGGSLAGVSLQYLMESKVLVPEVVDVLQVAKLWIKNGLHEGDKGSSRLA